MKQLPKEINGKKILIRVDLNCPVENGKITGSARIEAHAQTIKSLSSRGAKVIVLAHQGRKDHDDFISLEQHAKLLHQHIGKEVFFVDDTIGKSAIESINRLKNSEILVLENVRFLKDETEGGDTLAKALSKEVDYFVLDALSVAHRKHASVVGFSKYLPSFAGDVLATELEAIEQVRHAKNVTFVFGGSKVEDSFSVMEKWLNEGRAKEVMVGGALSVLLLHAANHPIGDSIEYIRNSGLEKYVESAKQLLLKHSKKIILPLDVALSVQMERHESDVTKVKHGQIWDIGEKTIQEYVNRLNDAECIVMNGPCGVYEVAAFAKGTQKVLETISNCDAFSLLGGGHTITAIERMNLKKEHFGYISLSGKALIEYLCGKSLPGLVAIEESQKNFK